MIPIIKPNGKTAQNKLLRPEDWRKNKNTLRGTFLQMLLDILGSAVWRRGRSRIDRSLHLLGSTVKLSELQRTLRAHRGSRVWPILSPYETWTAIRADAGRAEGLTNSRGEPCEPGKCWRTTPAISLIWCEMDSVIFFTQDFLFITFHSLISFGWTIREGEKVGKLTRPQLHPGTAEGKSWVSPQPHGQGDTDHIYV